MVVMNTVKVIKTGKEYDQSKIQVLNSIMMILDFFIFNFEEGFLFDGS